jgi:hypothetical protein
VIAAAVLAVGPAGCRKPLPSPVTVPSTPATFKFPRTSGLQPAFNKAFLTLFTPEEIRTHTVNMMIGGTVTSNKKPAFLMRADFAYDAERQDALLADYQTAVERLVKDHPGAVAKSAEDLLKDGKRVGFRLEFTANGVRGLVRAELSASGNPKLPGRLEVQVEEAEE